MQPPFLARKDKAKYTAIYIYNQKH